jgi:HK97 gp10 family phage protein
MRLEIDLQGEREIIKRLADLTPQLERKVLNDALRRAANIIKTQVQANIQEVRVTGRNTDPLRAGIRVRPLRRGRNRVGVAVQTPTRVQLAVKRLGRGRRLSVEAASELAVGSPGADLKWYYPAHIELGTKRTTAQPYMRQALEQQRRDAEETIRREIQAGIEKVTRGYGR